MATAPRSAEPMSLHDDVEEILLDSQTVANRVAELGAQLSADYAGRDPVLVSVLKGALVFLADLMRAMDLPTSIDLMEVSSYGAATETTGQVRILKDLSKPIEGRDVIVVEDIIDTGLTLNYLLQLPRRQAARVDQDRAACSTSRRAAWPRSRSTTSASRSRTDSSSATGSTSTSATGTCRTSAC